MAIGLGGVPSDDNRLSEMARKLEKKDEKLKGKILFTWKQECFGLNAKEYGIYQAAAAARGDHCNGSEEELKEMDDFRKKYPLVTSLHGYYHIVLRHCPKIREGGHNVNSVKSLLRVLKQRALAKKSIPIPAIPKRVTSQDRKNAKKSNNFYL